MLLCIVINVLSMTSAIAYAINQVENNKSLRDNMEPIPNSIANSDVSVTFSHFHMYVDKIDDLVSYKSLESKLNNFHKSLSVKTMPLSMEEKKELWKSLLLANEENIGTNHYESDFKPQNRDIIRQLIAGLGFRVTGYADRLASRTVLVSSRDPSGVQIIISAMKEKSIIGSTTISLPAPSDVCDDDKIKRFMESHYERQGIGVLAFYVDNVQAIYSKYLERHPRLIDSFVEYPQSNTAILEVFAYYKKQTHPDTPDVERSLADTGTTLRFVEFKNQDYGTMDRLSSSCKLFGMTQCDAIFDDTSMPAYCDHWVSNVFDRTEFINTLSDTLGFTPKVDFNAGVVAAGEAQIESTVTGNTSRKVCTNKAMALTDQSQVYLPINNALSSVGHVHGFLQEIGQGVQHVASRVENLVDFVQRCNEYRQITGEGFTFLRIPRSYYGILTPKILMRDLPHSAESCTTEKCAKEVIDCLKRSSLLTIDGALDLYADRSEIELVLDNDISTEARSDYLANRDEIVTTILSSRFSNLRNLLGNTISEAEYLGIVRNQILVDIQGGDLLYQIFTSNILQRKVGEEAPFLEFIQRVCSNDVIKPGCGGFGIRNFLTLFLSIEVSKAMQEVAEARDDGDEKRERYAQTMVDYFTDQMNESNPILTLISEAMTEEGICVEKLAELLANKKTTEEVAVWEERLLTATERKNNGNIRLMECSSRYNDMMKNLRQSR